MTSLLFRLERLSSHDRSGFSCGVPALDAYLSRGAGQDDRRRVAACFVLIEKSSLRIAGYYTLSACHLNLEALPPEMKRKLPLYAEVPAVRLGRLAVDLDFRGQKLGAAMLLDAVRRTMVSDISAHLMVVDAREEQAAAFYRHHGFQPDPDPDCPLRLIAPVAHLARALGID